MPTRSVRSKTLMINIRSLETGSKKHVFGDNFRYYEIADILSDVLWVVYSVYFLNSMDICEFLDRVYGDCCSIDFLANFRNFRALFVVEDRHNQFFAVLRNPERIQ